MFCKNGVLKNIAKLTEKHLCHTLFFNKVVGIGLGIYLEDTPAAQFFSWQYYETFQNIFLCQICKVGAETQCLRWYLRPETQKTVLGRDARHNTRECWSLGESQDLRLLTILKIQDPRICRWLRPKTQDCLNLDVIQDQNCM